MKRRLPGSGSGLTAKVLSLAKPVRLFVLDVDGVLTDNGMYLDGQYGCSKRFDIQDNLGLLLIQRAGIEVALLSGLANDQARQLAKDLGITEFHGGHHQKMPVLEGMLACRGLTLAQTAYMGDDWLDAPVMARVGLPMAPGDAQPEIRRLAAWVSTRPGGRGAVRQAVRFLLMAQGKLGASWGCPLD
jgi:3-deoxy-D-manno-octulosonate 8-phosphate phosphatase (KDO 8-P phosphatase)